MLDAKTLRELANRPDLLEVARRAIEATLLEFRDMGIFVPRNNGLVCREKDGTESSVIRLGSEQAMRIGLNAIADTADELGNIAACVLVRE